MDFTELTWESLLETQLKLKILHSSKALPIEVAPSGNLKKHILGVLLTVLYSISLKKVLSAKATNRMTLKYLKKFDSSNMDTDIIRKNQHKYMLDPNYMNTLAVNNIYEFYIAE
jgi:hypothetical protein